VDFRQNCRIGRIKKEILFILSKLSKLNCDMPELAEVDFYRRRWWDNSRRHAPGLGAGRRVDKADVAERSLVYRYLKKEFPGGAKALAKKLQGARMAESGTHGKQMWFVFKLKKERGKNLWVGIHLGMSGELRIEPKAYVAQKYDALVLRVAGRTLVFYDPRQFGRVRAWAGMKTERPPWLQNLPGEILGKEFTAEFVRGVLARHGRAPVKAVLLNQSYFPGIGNWMADEILWRAGIHPALPAGKAATPKIAKKLRATIQEVTRDALRVIAGRGGKLPPDMNVNIPDSWLFNHRWRAGGICPRTKKPLACEEIGGRTTRWSPARQKLPED
jgi:formamidopyrimidine-DNA glycosylase